MKKNNVNTLRIAAETGYNQVIPREKKKSQPSIYANFAFTSVNCKGMIVKWVVVVADLVGHRGSCCGSRTGALQSCEALNHEMKRAGF